jgi:hypothetical protein
MIPARIRSMPLAGALLVGVLAWAAPSGAEDDIATFPIDVAVATDDGTPVQDERWIDDEIAHAEALYGSHGVHFRRVGLRRLDEDTAHMVTRADRDRLVGACHPGVINVIVVESLKDVDEADRYRMGVHWRYELDPRKRYIILSMEAPPTVLAHELGHYFGNPHSTVANNIMSYVRTPGQAVFVDAAQVRILRAKAREALATHEIVPDRE